MKLIVDNIMGNIGFFITFVKLSIVHTHISQTKNSSLKSKMILKLYEKIIN